MFLKELEILLINFYLFIFIKFKFNLISIYSIKVILNLIE